MRYLFKHLSRNNFIIKIVFCVWVFIYFILFYSRPHRTQELENQAVVDAESWREQQLELQEQNSQQSRQKQEMEAELERCKQVVCEREGGMDSEPHLL